VPSRASLFAFHDAPPLSPEHATAPRAKQTPDHASPLFAACFRATENAPRDGGAFEASATPFRLPVVPRPVVVVHSGVSGVIPVIEFIADLTDATPSDAETTPQRSRMPDAARRCRCRLPRRLLDIISRVYAIALRRYAARDARMPAAAAFEEMSARAPFARLQADARAATARDSDAREPLSANMLTPSFAAHSPLHAFH